MTEPPRWRTDGAVVVVHPTEPAVWIPDEAGPALRFDYDGYIWFPDIEPVQQALRERWRLDAIVLRCLDVQHDREGRHLRETFLVQPRPAAMPGHGRWTPIADLDLSALPSDPSRNALRGPDRPAAPTRRPWAERGWFDDAVAWAEAALRAHGTPSLGPPAQLRTWGLSTVWRFGTASGDVFFKAAAHGPNSGERTFLFANEAALIAGLAARFPEHVPRPIAIDPERVWLLLPDAGPALAESDDLDAWEAAIRLHARHQCGYVGQETELLRIGCLDRRLGRLAIDFDELLTDEAAMAVLKPGDEDRLRAAAPAIRELIEEVAGLGIPETLVHGDLHAGNVGLRDGQIVFFDWTDACVGHPFLDLVTFLGGEMMPDAVVPGREQLRAAYLNEWQGVAGAVALARAAELVETLGMLHQAVSYGHMLPVLEEPDRSAMGWGVTQWTAQLLDRLTDLPAE